MKDKIAAYKPHEPADPPQPSVSIMSNSGKMVSAVYSDLSGADKEEILSSQETHIKGRLEAAP